MVKVEAIRIANNALTDVSDPAPLFTLITGPSEETRRVGETKKEIAESNAVRYHFWETFLARAPQKTALYNTLSPNTGNWIAFASGEPRVSFQTSIKQQEARVELVIDRIDVAENQRIFGQFENHKLEIEQAFGGPLQWYAPETARVRRIMHTVSSGGYQDDEARWPEIQDAIVDAMIQLEKALRPFIQTIE